MENQNAFPFKEKVRKNQKYSHNTHWQNHRGMSLRDYFAAKAMQAIITVMANTDNLVNGGYVPHTIDEHIAKNAYDVADAMLKQREV